MSRLDAVQRWPAWKNAPFTATDTAVARSASSSTMSGFLPPISSCTRAPLRTAAAATPGPTSCEPVKLTASMSGRRRERGAERRARSHHEIEHAWRQAGALDDVDERPRRRRHELGRLEHDAVAERQRRRNLPRRNRERKIPRRDRARRRRRGSRVTSTSMPGRTESIFSPVSRTASPAKNLKMAPARAASPMPSASGLPCSRDSSRPSSSLRARISVPARSRMSKRSCGVVRDHFVNAARAAAIAARASRVRAARELADDVGHDSTG